MKEIRQECLLKLLKEEKLLKVDTIARKLNVTNMTVRRDLQELENLGLLLRVHGGAKVIENDSALSFSELSHLEKKQINLEAKKQIAKLVAEQIDEGDTVFLGSGTTLELVYDYLALRYAKIMTNSIHVFNKFKKDTRFDLILIGGSFRQKTGAFVGTIANDFVSTIFVQKAFIGVNGVMEKAIFNSNEDEGLTQKFILDSAKKKYIVADYSKFAKQDFYCFYKIDQVDYVITDDKTPLEILTKYQAWTKVICPPVIEEEALNETISE